MPNVFTVVAKIRAAKGKGDAMAAFLTEQAAVVLKAEKGCLVYRVHRSTKDPELFLFYEAYADEAAFDVHRNSAAPRRLPPAAREGRPGRRPGRSGDLSFRDRLPARTIPATALPGTTRNDCVADDIVVESRDDLDAALAAMARDASDGLLRRPARGGQEPLHPRARPRGPCAGAQRSPAAVGRRAAVGPLASPSRAVSRARRHRPRDGAQGHRRMGARRRSFAGIGNTRRRRC